MVRGDYAYLATSDNTGEVMVIDISDPSAMIHPDITGMKFDAPGDHDGTSLDLLSNRLYLGRISGNNSPAEHNLFILDINSPGSIVSLGSKLLTKNPVQALGISTMAVSGPFDFIGATGDSNAEFQIFRIDDPSTIENCSEDPPAGISFDPPGCGKYDFPAKITDVDYHNNLIFSSVESNDAFRIMFDDINQYP